ncbi:acyl carrier protein [Glycomyces xiaoerkulensis]|uniref:acyl carrier protein n=1 Tax=Glycomyces xiaoerkulensis TaxID=2038139 RepID=UPI000C258321|nr:phosphopantetheine-binding protein [Glycomyces xiaoerkulensis]
MTDTNQLNRETVSKATVAALEETLGRELPEIEEGTSLFDELGLDSTSVLGVLISLEDSLDIEIDADSITDEHLATLGGLIDCVLATAQNG